VNLSGRCRLTNTSTLILILGNCPGTLGGTWGKKPGRYEIE